MCKVVNRFDRAPRLFGIVIAAAILILFELGLRLAGAGDYRDRPDPFGGFTGLPNLFERVVSADGSERYVARDKPGKTRSFLAHKPANGFRVFVLGGSSEAGTPYGYDYSFAEFLRVLLTEALPGRHVEVVNTATPGFASRRLLYVAREVAGYAIS